MARRQGVMARRQGVVDNTPLTHEATFGREADARPTRVSTSVESTLDHFLELIDFTFGHIRNGILRASLARLRSVPEVGVSADQALSYRRAGFKG